MIGYKAFDKDLKCLNDMQYEIGKEYKLESSPQLCKIGFHFCRTIADCYNFYGTTEETRICKVEALGDIVTDAAAIKYCTNHILILEEVLEPYKYTNTHSDSTGFCNTGKRNAGNYNTGEWNTGDKNIGNWNTGNGNIGNNNTGDNNIGNYNAGDLNVGFYNAGHNNRGHWNAGSGNIGFYNIGSFNAGYHNVGDWNTGDRNIGDWNYSNNNQGVFCTITTEPTIKIFDVDTDWTLQDWYLSQACNIMNTCPKTLSKFIPKKSMTPKEKEQYPEYKTLGGFIKKISVSKHHKQDWWNNLSDIDKEVIKSLPNFDAKKFYLCTGITV